MDQKDWLILKTLDEEKNLTRAADKLFISQPALTYRIKQLEADIGVKILWRGKRGIKFSTEGEYLVKYSQNMLQELQKMKDQVLNMNNAREGTIRLGTSFNFARFLLPDILKAFKDEYSNVQFYLFTGLSPDIVKKLEEEVYLGIIRGDHHWEGEQILLQNEQICIISPTPIELKDLPYLPRISYKTDHKLQQVIDGWWKKQFSIPPNITMHLDNIDTSRKLVVNGLGYAIIPSIGLNELEEDLYITPIRDEQGVPIERSTKLIYTKEALNFPVVQTFIDFLVEYFKYKRN